MNDNDIEQVEQAVFDAFFYPIGFAILGAWIGYLWMEMVLELLSVDKATPEAQLCLVLLTVLGLIVALFTLRVLIGVKRTFNDIE